MVETTLKPRAFAFILSNLHHVLGNLALFLAHVNIRQTSSVVDAGIPPDLCSPCGEVGTRSVSTVPPSDPDPDPFDFMPLSVACVAPKVLGTWCDCVDQLTHARHASLQPVLLLSLFSMLSGNLSEIEAVFSC